MFPCSLRYFPFVPLFPKTPGRPLAGMCVIGVACSGVALVPGSIVSGAKVVWGGVAAIGTSTEVAWLAAVCLAGTTLTGHKVDGEADVRQE